MYLNVFICTEVTNWGYESQIEFVGYKLAAAFLILYYRQLRTGGHLVTFAPMFMNLFRLYGL